MTEASVSLLRDRRPQVRPSARERLASRVAAVRNWLPRGNMLRPATFQRRHRLITRFALAQGVGLMLLGPILGRGVVESVFVGAIAATPAVFALVPSVPRTIRMLSAVVSLMFASAGLVDLCQGLTEAHFHFFVMVGVVSLYQDWAAFGMCVLITVVHHAVMGLTVPNLVFSNAAERSNPVGWACLHGGFVLAASFTHLIAWRLNEQQELRDPLTQLPNRVAFVDALTALLRDSDEAVSVLFVDVDDFKTINDSGGHHVGDQALFHAAAKMGESLRASDMVARIGGDEFAVLIPGSVEIATEAAERLSSLLQAPMIVDGREVFVTASIGVADSLLAGSRDPDDLLRDADLAMYSAKSAGKNRVVTYTAGIDRTVRDQAELAQDLRAALDLGQLEVHYQPVFKAHGERLCGVEALLRWHHPERGTVAPSVFIPLAERSGSIKAIGSWVLHTAAMQVAAWQRDLPGCANLELAVNLSPAQLRDPALLTVLSRALHESGLAPGSLILEVTESMLLSDLDLARRQLDAARTMGAQVAIDDFGTGYSSLSYLAKLPADQVKIDQSFVRELGSGDTSVALVRSILDLARALDLDVQAEGVEEAGQQAILTDLGCERSQGFLYSEPLSTDAFAEFVASSATALPGAAVVALPVMEEEQAS